MTIWENSTSVSLKKTPTSWAQQDTLQETIAFANKRKSLLVIQLKNKLSDLKPLFSHKKSLTFQKRSKKMFLHWTANLADQNKHQPLKIDIRVTYHTFLSVWNKPLIDTCQHCSTSRANHALRAFAGERRFSKSRGLSASVSFLPLLLPPLSFFWLLFHFSRGQNQESRSSVFPKPNGNACYAGYETRAPNDGFLKFIENTFLAIHNILSTL